MIDFGTVRPGTTLYIPFATYDSNDPSASVTLTGLAVTDIEIYKNGSTTQRSSDSGYALLDTDGIDFDLITGIHGISIDLADNTDAGFYVAGGQYTVVIASITVDAATVNFIAATFRIGYPNAILNTTIATAPSQTSLTLTAGPAEDNALTGMEVLIHDIASAVQVGRAVISAYTGASKTVTLAAATTFTIAAGDNISVMGPSPLMPTTAGRALDVSTGGEAGVDWANVGTPGATVALSATTVANVTTTATATNLTNERSKYMHGAVWIGPTANTNTTSYTDGIMTNPVSTIAAAKTVADNLGLKRFWTQAGVTVTLLADMAGYVFDGYGWTLATSGSRAFTGSVALNSISVTGTFTSAGAQPYWINCEFGATVSVPPSNFTHCEFGGTTTFNAAGNYDLVDCASVVAGTSVPVFAIPAGTVNVSFRRWSGGISITGITSGTTISIDAVSGGSITLAGADGNVQVRGMVGNITDNRTGTPTLGTNNNMDARFDSVDSALTTIDDFLDTEIAAIKAKTDQLTFTGTNRVDANVAAINNSTVGVAGFDRAARTVTLGTADSGATTTSIPTSSLSPAANVSDQFKGLILKFASDTTTVALRGQGTDITASTAGGTLTVTALTTAPVSGDTFTIQ